MKFTLYIPPPVYPPLPFAINVRPNCVVDLMGVQFYEDHVDTPVHPNVMTFQAERAYHEMWHALDWANLS